MVQNVWNYINCLQQQREEKLKHLKEISAKGVSARLNKIKTADKPVVDRKSLRKEAKEDLNNINKNTLDLFDNVKDNFKPSLDEVKACIEKEKLCVDAETFINFYESHGWMVGKTPIKNWQATLKLWHARAIADSSLKPPEKYKKSQPHDDENYWHELNVRLTEDKNSTDILKASGDVSIKQNVSPLMCEDKNLDLDLKRQPFERFMERVEKYDINSENDHD